MTRLVVLAVLLGPCTGSWHALRSVKQPVKSFDRSVLGNLRNAGEVADPRVSRSHMFVSPISVGTPPQSLSCLLDTGSADLWVPSKRCKNCHTEHHFHADESSTFLPAIEHTPHGDMPVPVEVDDNSGQIVGFIVQDSIGLGPWVFKNQSFLIVEESHLPKNRDWDGICGLGWQGMSSAVEPLYRNLQNHDNKATFSLVPSAPGTTFLVVGEVPHDFARTVAWTKAEKLGKERSFWVASGSVGTSTVSPVLTKFVIDTGTSFLLAPRKHYTKFLRELFPRHIFDHLCGADPAGDNLIVCDCSVTEGEAAKNELVMHLGGRKFALPVPKLFKKVPTTDGGELCLLHVQQNSLASVNPLDLLHALLDGGLGVAPGDSRGGQARSGKKMPVQPPFLFPPFLMPQAGSPPWPTDAEQVEEVTQTRPDGSVCTTTLVWVHGHLKDNTTNCHGRRLQTMIPGLPLLAMESPGQDKMSDMWVLGGAFLENFVTVLDFDNYRIGFGELTTNTHVEEARPSHPLRTAPAPYQDNDAHEEGSGWGLFFFGSFVLGLCGCAVILSRKMHTRKAFTAPAEREGEDGAELWEDNDASAAVAE